MAYQATRRKKCVETLELIREDGKREKTIEVEITAGKLARDLSREYVNLVRAQRKVQDMQALEDQGAGSLADAYEQLGAAVITMMETVFGKEDTQTIMDFYENDYVEIVQQIMSFIINVILPKAREIAQENRKQILSQYDRRPAKGKRRGLRQ